MEEREDIRNLIREGYTVCIAAGDALDYDGEPFAYKIFVLDSQGQRVTEAQTHDFAEAMLEVYMNTPEGQLTLDIE